MNTTDMIRALSAVVGALSLVAAADTYRRQNAAKRLEIFQAFNHRFYGGEFKNIREIIESDSPELQKSDYIEKHHLLGFFEELAVAINSRIMTFDVAYYFFGYTAIKIAQSQNFWMGDKMLDIDLVYWKLFKSFADAARRKEALLGKRGIDPWRLRF